MKDRVIRGALAILFLCSAAVAETSAARETDPGPCATVIATDGVVAQAEQVLPPDIVRPDDGKKMREALANACGGEDRIVSCPVETKTRTWWVWVREKTARLVLRPVAKGVVPAALLSLAVYGVLRALEAIEVSVPKEQIGAASAIFGMLAMKFVDAMMSPALTPLVSKFQQLNWMVSRLFVSNDGEDASAGGLDELYPRTQQKVKITTQAARSSWFEHAEVAEILNGHAAWMWILKGPNYKVVVPRLIAMNLRRLKHKFPDVDLTGDAEIEREFRSIFQTQFTFAALAEDEREEFVERVLWAMEKIEVEIEGENFPLSADDRAYYRNVLVSLIVVPTPQDDFVSSRPAVATRDDDAYEP